MLEHLQCRIRGHRVGRKSVTVTPSGTSQDGRCLRCGVHLVRIEGAWREVAEAEA